MVSLPRPLLPELLVLPRHFCICTAGISIHSGINNIVGFHGDYWFFSCCWLLASPSLSHSMGKFLARHRRQLMFAFKQVARHLTIIAIIVFSGPCDATRITNFDEQGSLVGRFACYMPMLGRIRPTTVVANQWNEFPGETFKLWPSNFDLNTFRHKLHIKYLKPP